MSSKFRIIRIPSTPWPNSSNQRLPEGIYNATLNYASYCYDEDREYGRVYLSLLITEGKHAGAEEYRHYNLTSREAGKHLQNEFRKFGVVVKDPEELSEACDRIMGMRVKLCVKYDRNDSRSVLVWPPSARGQGNASRN